MNVTLETMTAIGIITGVVMVLLAFALTLIRAIQFNRHEARGGAGGERAPFPVAHTSNPGAHTNQYNQPRA